MHFGGPAVSRETGISGQPWAPGTWERTGHRAAFGLPVTGAHFPGRALGALSSGAVPRGSWGPQRLWEVIFIPGPQGRDSVMVVLGERKDRVTSQGASPSLPARCVPGRLQPARLVCLLALPLTSWWAGTSLFHYFVPQFCHVSYGNNSAFCGCDKASAHCSLMPLCQPPPVNGAGPGVRGGAGLGPHSTEYRGGSSFGF